MPYAAEGQAAGGSTAMAPSQQTPPPWIRESQQAFAQGKYAEAAKLASQAASDHPQDPKAHELAGLTRFATGDYAGAAAAFRTALAIVPPDWPSLYANYPDMPTYRRQFDQLAKFLEQNRGSVDGRFVLGYLDLAMGHIADARVQLDYVARQKPQDQVVQNVLGYLNQRIVTARAASPSTR